MLVSAQWQCSRPNSSSTTVWTTFRNISLNVAMISAVLVKCRIWTYFFQQFLRCCIHNSLTSILNGFLFPFLTESILFILSFFVVYTDFSAVSTAASPARLTPASRSSPGWSSRRGSTNGLWMPAAATPRDSFCSMSKTVGLNKFVLYLKTICSPLILGGIGNYRDFCLSVPRFTHKWFT